MMFRALCWHVGESEVQIHSVQSGQGDTTCVSCFLSECLNHSALGGKTQESVLLPSFFWDLCSGVFTCSFLCACICIHAARSVELQSVPKCQKGNLHTWKPDKWYTKGNRILPALSKNFLSSILLLLLQLLLLYCFCTQEPWVWAPFRCAVCKRKL